MSLWTAGSLPRPPPKMAGRLSVAVTERGNKVGRAFIKPSTPKCLPPFPDSHWSGFLLSTVKWWKASFLPVSQRNMALRELVRTSSVGQMLREPPGFWRRSTTLRGACGSQGAESLSSHGLSYSHEMRTRYASKRPWQLYFSRRPCRTVSGALVTVCLDTDGVSYAFINGNSAVPA